MMRAQEATVEETTQYWLRLCNDFGLYRYKNHDGRGSR